MGRSSHLNVWTHFVIRTRKNKKNKEVKEATCKYCNKKWENAVVTRLAEHLPKCTKYEQENSDDDDVDEEAVQGRSAASTTQNQSTSIPSPNVSFTSVTSTANSNEEPKKIKVPKRMLSFVDSMTSGE